MALYTKNNTKIGDGLVYEIGKNKLSNVDIAELLFNNTDIHTISKLIVEDIHDFDGNHSKMLTTVIVDSLFANIVNELLSGTTVVLNELSETYNHKDGTLMQYSSELNPNIYKSYKFPDKVVSVCYYNVNNNLITIS